MPTDSPSCGSSLDTLPILCACRGFVSRWHVESESDRDLCSGIESQNNRDAREELHATSESLQDDAERVGAMEAE